MSDSFDQWRREGRTYRHRGHSIFYRAEGSGPSLLLLHGFPSASWDWHPLWSELTARFSAIAPDFIGFGWSDKPRDHEYSILDQADLAEGLLRELAVERVHLLAHDYGDTVAQELLARHEDRKQRNEPGPVLASACFLNGGLFPETHRPRLIQRLLASPLGPLIGRLTSKGRFYAGLTAIFGKSTPPSAAFLGELWTLLRHQDGHRIAHLVIRYMEERRRHRQRWVSALQRTSVPLRLVDGVADPISGAAMAQRYSELVPAADVVELPVGHYPQIEDPPAVLRAFLGFHDRFAAG